MKKLFLPITLIFLLSSCAIFKKKEKYGCPTSGAAVGAEQIASGDPKAMKAAKKSKYKGGKKF
jgi:Prokaryotic membrane lipoprotein lipid attachment site